MRAESGEAGVEEVEGAVEVLRAGGEAGVGEGLDGDPER